jgi:cytochrome c oxidase cbb3-type subunit 4
MSFENFILDARVVMTVVCMLVFVGIILWSYSASRKKDFEDAARLPFDDDTPVEEAIRQGATAIKERRHG